MRMADKQEVIKYATCWKPLLAVLPGSKSLLRPRVASTLHKDSVWVKEK